MKTIDSFERREAVVDSMPRMFEDMFKDFGIDRNNFEGESYILWIETRGENSKDVFDDLISKNSKGLTLSAQITDDLHIRGFKIAPIEVRPGAPEGNQDKFKKKEISDVVLYLEKTIRTPSLSTPTRVLKAQITLAPGSLGALKQPEGYVIDSENAPYNIGRVIEPGDQTDRVNDIEIIDETREYSSRCLAHIGFVENIGFFIQREKPTETNSVEIMRKNETRTLKNESATVILKDGDRLKLRQIILNFHMITE